LSFVFEKTFNSQTDSTHLVLKLTQFRISATLKGFGSFANLFLPHNLPFFVYLGYKKVSGFQNRVADI
jgi:hypothetical protein